MGFASVIFNSLMIDDCVRPRLKTLSVSPVSSRIVSLLVGITVSPVELFFL